MKLTHLLQEAEKDRAALAFLSQLVQKGPFRGKVFLAGGAPRDMELGRDPKDLDVVVKGELDAGIEFAKWAAKEIGNYKEGSNPVVFPTFGTAKFNLGGVIFQGHDLSDIDVEAVAPRKEKYTAGSRKPEVSGGDMKDDCSRRDFTVNSLLHDLTTGETLDLTGMGKADIKSGTIRTTLEPDVIFTDDPLRILRAVRFTAKYDWKLPMFMLRSIKKNAPQLRNISRERIHDEVNKMLLTDYPTKAMRLLKVLGLIPYVFVNLTDKPKGEYGILSYLPKELPLRLAGLFIDSKISGGDTTTAETDLKATKYSSDVIRDVTIILNNFRYLFDKNFVQEESLRRILGSLGEKNFDLVLRFADGYARYKGIDLNTKELSLKSKEQAQLMAQNPLPITGQDLIDMGLKPSPEFGRLLNIVKSMYIRNPKTAKDDYLKVIHDAIPF